MKATAATELQKLVCELAEKHGFDLCEPTGWLCLEMEGFNPLVISKCQSNKNLLFVAQEVEGWGEILEDPGIVLFTGSKGEGWMPTSMDRPNTGLRLYALPNARRNGLVRAHMAFGPALALPDSQAELAQFCDEWARELRAQGWLEKATRLTERRLEE